VSAGRGVGPSARLLAGVSVLIGSMFGFGGCSSTPSGVGPIKQADAYAAAINWYIHSVPAPTPTTIGAASHPLIVYVVAESGKAIDSQVQASVIADMASRKNEVTVRFADVRDDALDVGLVNQPVKDNGALLLVGEVDEGLPPVRVAMSVYRNAADDQHYEMDIVRSGESVTATAQTTVGQG
jgi:hypothetical protein